jgi:RNA polymerase sigma factor (sigma-70 family)
MRPTPDREAAVSDASDQPALGVVRLPASQEERYAREGRPIVTEMATRIARQLGGSVPACDLESLGNEALVRLIRRYDPATAPFAAYLRLYLRWAILDKIRRGRAGQRGAVRSRALAGLEALGVFDAEPEPRDEHAARWQLEEALSVRAMALAMPFLASSPDGAEPVSDSTRSPDRVTVRAAAIRALRAAISQIEDTTMREVVVRHYFGDEPFEQIADDLGLSPSQICRMHRNALAELHDHLQTAGVSPDSR